MAKVTESLSFLTPYYNNLKIYETNSNNSSVPIVYDRDIGRATFDVSHFAYRWQFEIRS